MELAPFIEEIHRQVELAAEAGGAEAGGEEARALAERLIGPLDAAVRLSLLEALSAATEEITCELAPGSVEVRLRGRDPEFVVTPAPEEARGFRESGTDSETIDWSTASVAQSVGAGSGAGSGVGSGAGDDGGTARINLRMPEHLKLRVDQTAAREGLSVNSWLVRAAAAALERSGSSHQAHTHQGRSLQSSKRFTGWAR
jgi:hypothetical protein